MTTTDYAAMIREQLKTQHGWTSRQVSIRAQYFSLGSSIDITIKDPTIPLTTVKQIAEQAEHIRRDERTGEILGGGNRYVSVRYSSEALDTLGRRYADAVQRAVNEVDIGSQTLQQIDGTRFLVGRPDSWRLTLWDMGEHRMFQHCASVNDAARAIGCRLVGETQ
jgi:hypothetical protein